MVRPEGIERTITIAIENAIRRLSAAAIFSLFAMNAPADPLPLVRDGKIQAVVVAPLHPAPEEEAAARDLAEGLERLSGDAARIVPAGLEVPGAPALYVGRTGAPDVSIGTLEAMGPDALVMRRAGHRVFLFGATPQATRMAVSRFLQEEGGVRWYIPGGLGLHVPARTNWALNTLDRLIRPTFLSRSFSGLGSDAEKTWAMRNGLRGHLRLGHNLHRVFPPDLFTNHPDFFPMVEGARLPPPPGSGPRWQPCFGNPEAADYAGREAAAQLAAHPEWNSFSLAMNDSLRLCECPACRALLPNRFFRNMPDASDLVFTFVSRAARGVETACPGRMITAYAYQWCENAPSFDLPPNVAVYLTADRSFWHVPAFRAEDGELIRRWTRRCSWVGLYDYYYGVQYAVPRVFPASIADTLKFAAREGVKGFYAELYPFWALDGPKAWLAAQLLWDSEQDPAALLDEYYRNFFDEAAAPMRAFFEFCEARWRNQGGRPAWLKHYKSWQQFEIFPASARAEARALLDRASEAAREGITKRRVAFVSAGFRVTELYGRITDLVDGLSASTLPNGAVSIAGSLAEIRALREELLRLIEESSSEDLPPVPAAMAKVFPFPPEIRLAKRVAGWIDESPEGNPRSALESELAALDRLVPAAGLGLALRQAGDTNRQGADLLLNGGFEEPSPTGLSGQEALWAALALPGNWTPVMERGAQTAFTRWGGEARSGTFSLRAEGADLEWVCQTAPAKPGAAYRLGVFARGRLGPGASVSIQARWLNSRDAPLNGAPQVLDLAGPGAWYDWTELAGFSVAPPKSASVEIRIAADGFAHDDRFFFDDASLRLLWGPTPDRL